MTFALFICLLGQILLQYDYPVWVEGIILAISGASFAVAIAKEETLKTRIKSLEEKKEERK